MSKAGRGGLGRLPSRIRRFLPAAHAATAAGISLPPRAPFLSRAPFSPRCTSGLLLALALSSLFVQRYDTGHFAHYDHFHNHHSAQNLLVAANLSFERRLLLFKGEQPQPDSTTTLDMYSRFPVGGSALIKLAMLPFEGEVSAQIVAARTLMLALFCAAAMLAFDALRRIVADPWAALAATLLAFSSLNLLRWSDMVSTEAMTELAGFFLVFHGMVLRWQGRGTAQLLAKICVALLLGWSVYGLLLAYVAIGLAAEARSAWRRAAPGTGIRAAFLRGGSPRAPLACERPRLRASSCEGASRERDVAPRASLACERPPLKAPSCEGHAPRAPPLRAPSCEGHAPRAPPLRALVLALVRSRCLAPALVAIAFGTAVLGFNLANEYAAYDGERALAALPTVQSARKRLGFAPSYSAATHPKLAWPFFLYDQSRRIGTAMLPQALAKGGVGKAPARSPGALAHAALGALALAACLGALLFRRPRVGVPGARALLATLAASGLAWCLPMRHGTAYHQFYELYYVGVPLTLFVLLFVALRKLRITSWVPAVAAVAVVPLFILSVAAARGLNADADGKALQQTALRELGGFRDVAVGKTVFLAYGADLASPSIGMLPRLAPYFALAGALVRQDWGRLSRRGFCRTVDACRNTYGMRTSTSPAPETAPGRFAARRMAYDFIVVPPSAPEQAGAPGLPVTATSVPPSARERAERATPTRNDADPALLTPDNRFALVYDGAAFATVHDFYRHWFRWQYRALAGRQPTARSEFDLYLLPRGSAAIANELAYLKEKCSEADVLGRFFVHVVPKDERSLRHERRQYGFDDLDFRFDAHGTFGDGWCMARIGLPDYDWLRIDTGRYTEGEGEIWRVRIEPGDPAPPRSGPAT